MLVPRMMDALEVKLFKGFKEFISRGNAIDLAVGVVIGAAFSAIVNALVEKFINPLIGGLIGKPNFDNFLEFHIGDAVVLPGAILTALVNFLIIAFALYLFIVLPMNKWNEHAKARKDAQEDPVEETPDADIALLTEIRDLLKENAVHANQTHPRARGKHSAEPVADARTRD
ncbi:large conductance mechanosensitive channel protein MscL [Gleimia hominis]|uniref:large conductance mechanosensitive channel protein MscL n=1 Tax=Gleimia hominis TaxID=595468 RepID=UPI0033064085